MHYVCIKVPAKDFSTGEWEQKEALVLEKSEWDRIRGHTQFLHKDAEYAEQQNRLQENLKEYSRFTTKDWKNTFQVRKDIAFTYMFSMENKNIRAY
jgi:hypothetical protein